MCLIVWYIRAVLAGLAVGGLCVLLAHMAGAAEPSRSADVWTVLATDGHAGRECGLATHLREGADLRLVIADGEVRLITHHAGWMLPAGQADAKVTTGHDAFVGAATVASRDTLIAEDLSQDFLRHFMAAPVMTADFGGIRWTVDLHRSDNAAWALASCASAAGLADAT
jgi:hypothetical protein